MVGSQAVIALPGQPVSTDNPGEYALTAQSTSGIVLMSSNLQTLMNSQITQQNGKTTATFVKQLSETGKLPIVGTGDNTFIWAYGFDNTLSFHKSQGSFTVALSPCTDIA